jgi:transcriptional regulator of acetoin/glycerol metabolism
MSNHIESKHARTVVGFVRGASDRPEHSMVSSAIGASWRRCMIDYSLDPERPLEACVLDGHTLQEYRSRHEHLIQVASAEIDWLYDHIAMSGCALLLTDAGGIVLYEKVDPTILGIFRKAGLQLGSDWSESRQGTNGMGTCIAENRPIIVHRDAHPRSGWIPGRGAGCLDHERAWNSRDPDAHHGARPAVGETH